MHREPAVARRILHRARSATAVYPVGRDLVVPIIYARESKAATIELMRSAKRSLDITTHAIDDADYVREIRAAARRGAKVRIVFSDPRYAGYSKRKAAAMRDRLKALSEHPRIEALAYPNSRLQFGTSAFIPEFHTKLVIADEKRAYLGDNNLYYRAENIGAGAYVEGPTATRLARFFLEAYDRAGARDFTAPRGVASNRAIRFLDSRSTDHNIKREVLRDIRGARSSVFVMQYLLSDPDIIEALVDLKRRRPAVRIEALLGRKHATIGVLGKQVKYPFNLLAYRELTRAGIDARFVSEKNFVHGKLMVVDSKITHLGSADFVYRSLEGNLETNLRHESSAIARHFLQRLRPVFREAKGAKLRLRDHLAIDATRALERMFIAGFNACARGFHASRMLRGKNRTRLLDKTFWKKIGRSSRQFLSRTFRRKKKVPPVDLAQLARSDGLLAQIRSQFEVLHETSLTRAPSSSHGVFLLGGHTAKRARVIRELGPQLSHGGDIGAGIYLTDNAWVAHEYSKLHGQTGPTELILYHAQLDKPFRLPSQKREYALWRQAHPSRIKRNYWQLLSEFCHQRGYDSVVMENFEGKRGSYFLIFDRQKVQPVSHFTVRPKETAGWRKALRGLLPFRRRRDLERSPKERPSLGASLNHRGFRYQSATQSEYKKVVLDIMKRDRGLVSTNKLNREIRDLDKHVVFRITDATGRPRALFRLIEGYNITRYPTIYRSEHEKWKSKNIAGVALYPEKPQDEYIEGLFRAALDSAVAYRSKTGRPDALYIEVRPDKMAYYEKLGFKPAGYPFIARAWDGQWVPMLLDLSAYPNSGR